MMRPATRSGAPPGQNEPAAELGGSGGGEISKRLASNFRADDTRHPINPQDERAERLLDETVLALGAMQRGATLHHTFVHGGGGHYWRLSDGRKVSHAVAAALVRNAHVVGRDDGLFADTSQSFVWRRSS
jgi:hypothetical protein